MMNNPRSLVLIGLIFGAALFRLLPHPWNFSPVAAIALFGGAHFKKRFWAFFVPFTALLISDFVLGFYSTLPVVYGSFAVVVVMGMGLGRRRTGLKVVGVTFLSSLVFFVLTNLGTWAFTPLYPKTQAGLVSCFTLALPFFQNTLLGDQFFTAFLFGTFFLVEKRFVLLRESVYI